LREGSEAQDATQAPAPPAGPTGGPRLSIAHKFALLTALLVAGTAIFQGLVLYEVAANGFLDLEQAQLANRVKDSARNFVPDFEDLRRDAQFMLERPAIPNLMAVETNHVQAEAGALEDSLRRVAALFAGFLRANPTYISVSYLTVADGGKELIRVERERDRITVADETTLGSRLTERDLQRLNVLRPGNTSLSDIELRRLNGSVLDPPQPVVRASVAVFTPDNKLYGAVVLEADAGQWMAALAQSAAGTDTLYLANHRGDYLLHPDSSKTFGFERGQPQKLNEDLPQLDPIFRNARQEEVRYLTDSAVYYAFKLHFDPENPDRFLVMAVSSPKDVLLASTREMGNWSIYITLAMIIVGLVGSRLLSRPLDLLMTSARRIASGDVFASIRDADASSEETRVLVDAFRVMTGAVQDRETSLRETEATTSAILQSAGNSILTVSEDGTIDTANRAALMTFGFVWRELLGAKLSTLLPAAKGRDEEFIRQHIGGNAEQLARKADGTTFPVLMTVAEVPLAYRKIFTVVLVDLTEVKKADRAKDDFISVVSHELRTPLTSIRGALGLVTSQGAEAMPDKTKQLLQIAYNNSERLVRLINDILDMEKLGAGRIQMELQPLDAKEMLERAVEVNEAYGHRYNVRFVLDDSGAMPAIVADADRFLQVMANLMSNAAKFSPAGSQVDISTRIVGSFLRVSVRDHGKGIPRSLRPRIFEKFVQGDHSDTRRYEGTGLGLSITRELVLAMGGAIEFETEDDVGTTFHVDFPLASAASTAAPLAAAADARSILVCEDDPSLADVWKATLENVGHRVFGATTLHQARELIQRMRFDAILLDLMLPDGNGIDLIRSLRADAATRDIPVVVISARSDAGRKELNGDAINVVDWLAKPVTPERMLLALNGAIARNPGHRPHILHVEDDRDLVLVLGQALKDKATLTSVGTLFEAKQRLAEARYDLIVLDLALPDGSGAELLRFLSMGGNETTPVIVLSASEADEDTRRLVNAALVKSRLSESRIIDIISSHIS
jgi:PAS domain S-box-containing protein